MVGPLYVSTAPDLFPLLDFTLESENPALNSKTCLPLKYVANIYQKLLQYILD
jgi:hypothetical protein